MRKKTSKPNYRAFFILGLFFLIIYFFPQTLLSKDTSYVFLILGIIYVLVGLKNKKQWGKEKPLDPGQKKTLFGAIVIGIFVFLLGVIFYSIK
ncbi:MAG: hypothetical protein V1697_01515 [Candidatus Levyibacteriota bacterium]